MPESMIQNRQLLCIFGAAFVMTVVGYGLSTATSNPFVPDSRQVASATAEKPAHASNGTTDDNLPDDVVAVDSAKAETTQDEVLVEENAGLEADLADPDLGSEPDLLATAPDESSADADVSEPNPLPEFGSGASPESLSRDDSEFEVDEHLDTDERLSIEQASFSDTVTDTVEVANLDASPISEVELTDLAPDPPSASLPETPDAATSENPVDTQSEGFTGQESTASQDNIEEENPTVSSTSSVASEAIEVNDVKDKPVNDENASTSANVDDDAPPPALPNVPAESPGEETSGEETSADTDLPAVLPEADSDPPAIEPTTSKTLVLPTETAENGSAKPMKTQPVDQPTEKVTVDDVSEGAVTETPDSKPETVTPPAKEDEPVPPAKETKAEQPTITRASFLGVGIREIKGTTVTSLHIDSTAESMGITIGDKILAVDGTEVNDLASLRETLKKIAAGKEIVVTVRREDSTVKLGPKALGAR